MPQVDLEELVSACTDGCLDQKIACADNDHSDFPPTSFWLSGDAEYDWWDRNAVYQRNESTKGNSISSTNLNAAANNNSQRFSKNLKSSAAIIGLPKPRKTSSAEAKNRRNQRLENARLFPKRSASVSGKSEHCLVEPSSPKVSCIGRVRSKRDRNRTLRTRQRSISSTATATSTTSVTTVTVTRQKSKRSQRKKAGFLASVRAIFQTGGRGKAVQKADLQPEDSSSKQKRSCGRKTRGSTGGSTERSVV